MTEYHVGAGLFGIYCGTLNKPLKNGSITWRNKTECTDEALCAVRDFLKTEADSKNCPVTVMSGLLKTER